MILLAEVGSTAHGTGLPGHEDHDECGVLVEAPEQILGLGAGFRTRQYRTAPEGKPSQPWDSDRTLYSLRHFLRLAVVGNPSILMTFYAPALPFAGDDRHLALGDELRRLGPAFIGRHIVPRYRGYMLSQVDKLERNTGQRQELVDAHGYDTKFAMHAARLGFQCIELLTTRRLELPIGREVGDWLRAVRRGEISKGEWRGKVRELDATMLTLAGDTTLPAAPDRATIEEFAIRAHRTSW